MGNKAGEGNAHGNIGNDYRSLGNFKEAVECHKLRLAITKEVGDRAGEGSAYGDLGNTYNSLGYFNQAIEYHKQNLSIAKEIGDRNDEGLANCNLGNAYHNLRDLEKAIEHHSEYIRISVEVGNRAGEGFACGNLGNAYHDLGDFQKAMEYHKHHFVIAKESGDRAGEDTAYGNLGNAYYCLDDPDKAIEYLKKNLRFAKEVGDLPGEARACYSLGLVLEYKGSLGEALDYYKSSVKLYNDLRDLLQSQDEWKISFRNKCQSAYAGLWRTLLMNGDIKAALCAAEKGRAQALTDVLRMQYGFEVLPLKSFEHNEELSQVLRAVSTQTVFLAIEKNVINTWLICEGNEIYFTQTKLEDGCASEDAASLLMEATFKDIGVGVGVRCENRSLDEPNDLPSNRGNGEQVVMSSQCTNNSLRPLYDPIIGPIEHLLQGDELIIVPDGPLCLAPYTALSDSIRIRVIPSLTSLQMIADAPKEYHSRGGALLVGDPCLEKITNKRGRPKYSQLKYARKEVEMVGEILNTQPLTGEQATKNEVLERIKLVALVHIATHGRMETGEIALAPNPGWKSKIPREVDYILKISDVQAVKPRARLVVLSCCHSGRGKVTAEGVVGIARAFLGAGARSVLVTLWAIDDEATMEFVKSFYQHLREGKSVSVALHQAMKSLRESENFSAVKYWAPFVLIGDDVTLDFAERENDHCKWNLVYD